MIEGQGFEDGQDEFSAKRNFDDDDEDSDEEDAEEFENGDKIDDEISEDYVEEENYD